MGDKTGIEWTDATWNPTTGCDRVSPGCDHCYAMTLAPRLKAMGSAHYQTDGDPRTSGEGFGIAMHADALGKPLRWTRPRRIFVNSMSDLFHDGVTDEFIARVWAVMALSPQHTFQILTKRHGRMRSLLSGVSTDREAFIWKVKDAMWNWALPTFGAPASRGWHALDPTAWWPLHNVWLGVSVEDQKRADLRIPHLLATPAAVRFLSMEPLLGATSIAKWLNPERDCNCMVPRMEGAGQHASGCACHTQPEIDWVIVGGESGPGARPMHPDWARSLRDQCVRAEVPFHFKQWGEWVTEDQSPEDIVLPATGWAHLGEHEPTVYKVGKKAAGRELDGRTWDQYPTDREAVAS